MPRTAELYERGVPLSIGSDSHATIDPFAELRSLENQSRAATHRRCVVADATGAVAPALLGDVGSTNGYAALGFERGDDGVLLDADAPALLVGSGATLEVPTTIDDLAAAAATAGHPGLVDRVRVLGEEVVVDGRAVAR